MWGQIARSSSVTSLVYWPGTTDAQFPLVVVEDGRGM